MVATKFAFVKYSDFLGVPPNIYLDSKLSEEPKIHNLGIGEKYFLILVTRQAKEELFYSVEVVNFCPFLFPTILYTDRLAPERLSL
jgi:hypothetical protein